MNASEFTSPEQAFAQERDYQDMLVTRYLAKLPMPKLDVAEAKRIIKQRKEQH